MRKVILTSTVTDIVVVWGEDWCGFYVNGVLKRENHSFDPEWVREHIVGEYVNSWDVRRAEKYVFEHGDLPYLLKDVKFDD